MVKDKSGDGLFAVIMFSLLGCFGLYGHCRSVPTRQPTHYVPSEIRGVDRLPSWNIPRDREKKDRWA